MENRHDYTFPRTRFVDCYSTFEQLAHIQTEVQELVQAYKSEPVERVAEEALDLIHSTETLLRILQERHGLDIAQAVNHVTHKNALRGYYNGRGSTRSGPVPVLRSAQRRALRHHPHGRLRHLARLLRQMQRIVQTQTRRLRRKGIKMTRSEILETAREYVTKDRQATHGDLEDNFSSIADLWAAYLGINILPHDVAVMQALLKIGRIKSNSKHADNWIDMAGYAACGGELSGGVEK